MNEVGKLVVRDETMILSGVSPVRGNDDLPHTRTEQSIQAI